MLATKCTQYFENEIVLNSKIREMGLLSEIINVCAPKSCSLVYETGFEEEQGKAEQGNLDTWDHPRK